MFQVGDEITIGGLKRVVVSIHQRGEHYHNGQVGWVKLIDPRTGRIESIRDTELTDYYVQHWLDRVARRYTAQEVDRMVRGGHH